MQSLDNTIRNKIFKNRIVIKTDTYPPLMDLPKYTRIRREPVKIKIDSKISKETANRCLSQGLSGLAANSCVEQISPKPFQGHCMGNTMVFLKKWLKTYNIEKTAGLFKRGAPFEATIWQQISENWSLTYYPELVEPLIRVIETYPRVSFSEEKKIFHEKGGLSAVILLEAIYAFLGAKKDPLKDDLIAEITSWIEKNHEGKRLGSFYLGTLVVALDKLGNHVLGEKVLTCGLFAAYGLEVENITVQAHPGDVLRSVNDLNPGAYALSLPCYSPFGKLQNESHSIAFVIKEGTKNCYIFDSNEAIALTPKEELQATIGRLFTHYTGWDFSENLDGERPKFWRKLKNVMSGGSGPF